MATLQSVCQLTKVNTQTYFLAILTAFFLQIVTAGQAFSDGGHGGTPVSRPNAYLPVTCLPYSEIHRQLTRAGEIVVALGPTLAGQLAYLYLNPDKGAWTWVGLMEIEQACVIAAGEGWRDAPPPLQGDPL